MIYADEKGKKWGKRPLYFSFNRIIRYPEVQKLIILATLAQTASYINIYEDHPEKNRYLHFWPMHYYMLG